ncbi:TetR/AcrR family transcriptional regulator [Rhizobium sp. NTR19]|uniref:TetR/AcrR family transcriptional regulator n=1 Tax=Neorhizobium turbinariae TaxID=2937795 RepID=A0ABT0IPX9_9HYPH|nr:TetR/AcrR family transcriptional regulator [Neorhizobium turbinariae]MCK8779914.1 TetR/AcrR family transcriptional regulator [Neorhizobium turbinariae]
MRRSRNEMIAETRQKLLSAGRRAFGELGYAEASMDDFTAKAGLTRGALYHHFGDKKGLFAAVVAEIDAEMSARLCDISSKTSDRWQGFVDENVAYVLTALEPEIQRIMFRDGPAVLGDPSQWPNANHCIATVARSIENLRNDGLIVDIDPEAAARLVNAASSSAAQWIANSDDPDATSKRAVKSFKTLLEGLRIEKDPKR